MVEVLARLFYLTGKSAYRDRADALMGAFAGEIQKNFFPLASFLNASEFAQNALQIVIVGQRGEADTDALLITLRAHSLPDLVLSDLQMPGLNGIEFIRRLHLFAPTVPVVLATGGRRLGGVPPRSRRSGRPAPRTFPAWSWWPRRPR